MYKSGHIIVSLLKSHWLQKDEDEKEKRMKMAKIIKYLQSKLNLEPINFRHLI